jgi:hypothetical protein
VTEAAQETDTERAVRESQERDNRSRAALRFAPDLLHHVRAIAISSPERGETLPEWNAPMRITALHESDLVFSQLVDWRSYWQQHFDGDSAPASGVYRRDGEVQGFAAGTTPALARILTRTQSAWLLDHADHILGEPSEVHYHLDVADMLFDLRAQFPTSKPLDLTAVDNSQSKFDPISDPEVVDEEIRLLLVQPYLTPREVGILVRKSKRQINRMIADPNDPLPTYSHEGQKYVRLEETRDWIAAHETRNR